MKVFLCQWDIVWENKQANFEKVDSLLARVQPPRDSLVVLPEMFATGFTMNIQAAGEEEPSPTERFLSRQARRWGVYLAGGLVRLGAPGRGRNQAVVFDPEGGCLARYTKIHPFSLGGEGEHYEAGSELVLVRVGGWVVAPFLCYDLRFPELFRIASAQGAQAFLVMANWPAKRIGHWLALLQARAIENQAYVAGVNRCGQDPNLSYNGQTLLVNPNGEIVARGDDQETVLCGAWDRDALESLRSGLPFLKDRRGDYDRLRTKGMP